MGLSERIIALQCQLQQRKEVRESRYDKLSDSEKYSEMMVDVAILKELSELAKGFSDNIVSRLAALPRPESDLNKKQFNSIFEQVFTKGAIIHDADATVALMTKIMEPENFGKDGYEEESVKIAEIMRNMGELYVKYGEDGSPQGSIYYDHSAGHFVNQTFEAKLGGEVEEFKAASNFDEG